jgi:hypothetical protein
MYLVSMVRYESLAYPLSNAPTLNKIRSELSKKWARKVGTLKVFLLFYFWVVSLVLQTAVKYTCLNEFPARLEQVHCLFGISNLRSNTVLAFQGFLPLWLWHWNTPFTCQLVTTPDDLPTNFLRHLEGQNSGYVPGCVHGHLFWPLERGGKLVGKSIGIYSGVLRASWHSHPWLGRV